MKPIRWPRITGEGIEYCNPFNPHLRHRPVVKGRGLFWGNGYFTDGSYLIKLDEKPKVKTADGNGPKPLTKEMLEMTMPKELGNGTRLLAEIKQDHVEKPFILVEGNGQIDTFDPDFIDHILTLYPDSIPYLLPKSRGGLVFHNGKEILGFVMPRNVEYFDYFNNRLEEIKQELN